MRNTRALIPQILESKGNSLPANLAVVMGGALLLSALAQVTIPLPFTPVPITGQTFGVALTALLWGRSRGLATLILYVCMGASGLPVFAAGKSGLAGATSGYLTGMIVAAYFMGWLADLGWTKTFRKAWLAAFIGSACTFAFGLLVLSLYVPTSGLLMAGLIPFIPGDIIKTALAAAIASKANSHLTR